jgi:simple sugar transport system ATP-binding protein
MDPFLQLRNVSKTFGEVAALRNVDFEVGANEIVGLLGDNGAGKSTLVKILTGYHQPDPGGKVYLKGQEVDHLTVARARDLGIEVVYQERALADKQSLWRNIFMGRELSNVWGKLDLHAMKSETRKLMTTLMGFTSAAVTPESVVKTFSGGERQGVAITRALYFKAECIILDEPTMGLSLSETKKCLDFVAGIKSAGKSAIFIDHNIFHVYPVADRLYLVAQTGSLEKGGSR